MTGPFQGRREREQLVITTGTELGDGVGAVAGQETNRAIPTRQADLREPAVT